VEGRAPVVGLRGVAAAPPGARRVLDERLDAVEDPLYALSAAMPGEQHEGDAQVGVVVLIVEGVVCELGEEQVVRAVGPL